MWLDDDGDDDPFGGPLPDPSTRHWRHPSELGAQNAKIPDNPVGGFGAGAYPAVPAIYSRPWRWPAGAIGGGLVVAAIGVLGLSLTDGTSSEVLSTGTLPAQTVPASLVNPALSDRQSSGRMWSELSPPEAQPAGAEAVSDTPGNDSAASESSGWAGSSDPSTTIVTTTVAARAADLPSAPPTIPATPSTTSQTAEAPGATDSASGKAVGRSPDRAAIDPEILSESSRVSERLVPPMIPAHGLTAPFGAGVYASTDVKEPLASFIPVEGHILTSAAALDGRASVFLLIDQMWIKAIVVGADPATDVAVLKVDPRVGEIDLPTAITIPSAVEKGTDVFVGYCSAELVIGTTTTIVSGSSADTSLERPPEVPSTPADGCLTEPRQNVRDRQGTIWSTARSVRILTNHKVYDPIKTGVQHTAGMAGSALRDLLGHVVGLVMSADNPSVAALPIDRAVAVADALVATGSGSATWLSVEGLDTKAGVLVTAVEEDSPAAEVLKAGDHIVAVDGRRILDVDHLMYRIRQTGDDGMASLTVKRSDSVHVFVIPMAETPPLEQEE